MDGELVDYEPVQKERRGVRERGQERGAWLARRACEEKKHERDAARERGRVAVWRGRPT